MIGSQFHKESARTDHETFGKENLRGTESGQGLPGRFEAYVDSVRCFFANIGLIKRPGAVFAV
jgi:hypothetical protein